MRPPGRPTPVSIPPFSLDLDDDAHAESPQLELELVAPEPQPDQVLEKKEEEARIRTFVVGLSNTDRDVVQRLYWDDASQAAVARALNVSEAAVSKRHSKVLGLGR